MAKRDFGPETAESVLTAWAYLSEAVGHIPAVNLGSYYVGPDFLGPCHPLVPSENDEIPEVFHAVLFYLQEGDETFSKAQTEQRTSLVMKSLPADTRTIGVEPDDGGDGWDIVLAEYVSAADLARTGWREMKEALELADTRQDQRNLTEELALTELVYRTFLTCANTVEFLLARTRYERDGEARALATMREIATRELTNARDALHIYATAPWLDLAERQDGYFPHCADMIKAKVKWLRDFLEKTKA